MFSYAGIFADADDYYTGNLVVGDNAPPPGLEENNMYVVGGQRRTACLMTRMTMDSVRFASFRCNYSYAFDTQADPDFYTLQKVR